jgi:hypothetical protein
MRITLLALALLQGQGAVVKGAVGSKGGSMTPVDAVAVWDPAKKELRVALLPVQIRKEALHDIRKDSTMFAGFGEKSPDPKKWPDWCPAGEVKLVLDDRRLVESYHFWVYGLAKKNYTHNMNQSGDAARKDVSKLELKLDAKGGGTFHLAFAAKSEFEDGLSWDLAIQGVVVPPLAGK